jgi:hypothetical protein
VRILDDFKKDVRCEYSKVIDLLGLLDDGRQEFPHITLLNMYTFLCFSTGIFSIGFDFCRGNYEQLA